MIKWIFAIRADQRKEIKENEKIDMYLDLAGELKKLWNMRVVVIPNVVGANGMVPKGLEKRLEELELRGKMGIIHTIGLLKIRYNTQQSP